ncbi:hypothetical protein HZB88_01405 [archaeon]|nr:hypothetical protein [archaeon]
MRYLSQKEVEQLNERIEQDWQGKLPLDYLFFINSQNKIFIMHKTALHFNFTRLRINSIGLYFARFDNGKIRLSIEGSQLISPQKNIMSLDLHTARQWLKGLDIDVCSSNEKFGKFPVIKYKDNILGCGMLYGTAVKNTVPKERRLKSITSL